MNKSTNFFKKKNLKFLYLCISAPAACPNRLIWAVSSSETISGWDACWETSRGISPLCLSSHDFKVFSNACKTAECELSFSYPRASSRVPIMPCVWHWPGLWWGFVCGSCGGSGCIRAVVSRPPRLPAQVHLHLPE